MNKPLLFAILLVAGIVIMAAGCTKPQDGFDTLTFEKSIINDAKAKYPSADVIEIEGSEIIGGINMTNVRVSFNSNTICPTRMRLRYRQTFGYETGVPTYLVKDCQLSCTENCIITGEEEAIIAAHKLPGTQRVSEFVGKGQGIKASASYVAADGTWVVEFTRESDGAEMIVTLTAQNPTLLKIEVR